MARELRDQAVSAHPVEQRGSAMTDHLLWQGSQQAELFLHGCDSSNGGGKSNDGFTGHSRAPFCLHPALENGARNDCNDCYWGSNGAPFPSYSHPVSSNHALLAQSSASTASRHETTAQGIDDPEEDIINNKNNNPINFLSHVNGDSLALHALTAGSADEAALFGGGPSLDEHIAKLVSSTVHFTRGCVLFSLLSFVQFVSSSLCLRMPFLPFFLLRIRTKNCWQSTDM